MSRIEKAIEMAARERSQEEARPISDPMPVSSPMPASSPMPLPKTEAGKPPAKKVDSSTIAIDNPLLVTAHDPGSPASEQYRKLKSLIVKLSQKGDFEKALMITSSIPGEGKTITSLNLAIALAQEFDHTVLLVEADIRKPSILKYLGIKAERGLTDCILDDLDISDVLIKTGIGGLTVLPAGRRVDNPVELFSSNRMIALFDEIKSRYNDRYVIVDTTPLLPFAEPLYIANMIGAVVMVAREGVTTPDNLNSSLELLKNHNLLGVVSNGVRRVTSRQGYYGAYGYR